MSMSYIYMIHHLYYCVFQDNNPADDLQTPDTSVSQADEEMEDDKQSSVIIPGEFTFNITQLIKLSMLGFD